LKVELIQNIEDIFFNFLEDTGYTMLDYEMFDWQAYFKEVASFRTICINCSEAIIWANKLSNQERINTKAIDRALRKRKEIKKAKGKNPDIYGSNPTTSSEESEIGQMNRIYWATHPS